ncbi:MAG: RES family NAD+ phosphorylase [Chloroflexi bacterium]|nr:RES family NAD+ phosphorylase [Chloroflexota bacterium]
MSLDTFLRPWSGPAFRHIPDGSQFDVLDFRFAPLSSENRWNYQGDATLYLACDAGVALAEFARHLKVDRPPDAISHVVARRLFLLQVTVNHALDLRDAELCRALSLAGAPQCFLDKSVSRAVAQFLRRATQAQSLFVPSMALLDQPDRWILVLFLEKLPNDISQFLSEVRFAGMFSVSN